VRPGVQGMMNFQDDGGDYHRPADTPDFDEGYADKLVQEAVERATRELRADLARVTAERDEARDTAALLAQQKYERIDRLAVVEAERDRLRAALEYIADCDDPRWVDHCRAALEGQ
jgi:hypothetical protein